MKKHTTTGHWKLGFGLSIIAALFWSLLPIALKILLESMDPYTITWYRFLVAAFLLAFFVLRKHGLSPIRKIQGRLLVFLIVATVAVGSNYILFLLGLNFLPPSTAQVVIQFAPMFLLMGSILFFRESFRGIQWAGVAVFITGMLLFFNQHLGEVFYRLTNYTMGVLLIIAASVAWALYAMVQKQLLRFFRSGTIMLFLYVGGVLMLFMISHPSQLFQLNRTQLLILIFCGVNTLIAYGSFAEALAHWEASRVSAVITTVPLLTVLAMKFGASLFPNYIIPEVLNSLSILGAALVVVGSMMAALGQMKANKKIGYE